MPAADEEKEMLLRLTAGDTDAFSFFYRTYKRRIFDNLKRLLYSSELAEELLQETFYKLWLNRERMDTAQAFAPYLFRISANLAADHFRRAANDRKLHDHLTASGSELYDHIDTLMDYKESRAQLNALIATLPPKRQEIYRLVKLEGRTYEEVSQLLGISRSTIQDHIVKATHVIKAHFLTKEGALLLFLACLHHYQ